MATLPQAKSLVAADVHSGGLFSEQCACSFEPEPEAEADERHRPASVRAQISSALLARTLYIAREACERGTLTDRILQVQGGAE